MLRAAIYARYSTDLQRAASIEDQVRSCRARIEQEGWQLLEVYADHAVSGASSLRPGYQRLLEDARAGRVDVVLAEALDRLSRDQEAVAALYKQLGFADVRLITLAEGEISELHVGLSGTMNALYLKHLALKTRRGLEGRVRQGRSGGGLCYGYDVVPGDERGERKVNPAEAAVVRRIFRDYAAGRSPKAIALSLNAEVVPGPRGGAWGPSTIHGNRRRGTGILNNELYLGRLVWNRLRYVKDPVTGRRVSRANADSDLVVQEVPELRIVDDALWAAAKARQKDLEARDHPGSGDQPGFWDRRRPRFLLSGLMRCGVCGGGYSKISAHLFGCSTARNKGTCDNRLKIRRDVLEGTILDALRTKLMAPELVEEFAQAFIAETNRLRQEQDAGRRGAEAELARVERRIRSLVQAIADGAPPKALVAELRKLEARQEHLATQLSTQPATPAPAIHPGMAKLYREQVARLAALVERLETQTRR